MNTIPDFDSSAVHRFVGQLQLQTSAASKVYHSILNGFQRFVAQQSPGEAVSRPLIERWLRDRTTVWPPHMVNYRARLVDRFLDWRVIDGSLASNPLSQLRQDYGQTDTTSIVRALLAADSGAALEALRPPVPFASFLGPPMRDYVLLMRTMGYRYDSRAATFLRFDRFLQSRPELSGQSLDVLLREWTRDCPTAMLALDRLTTGRVLAKALRRQDPSVVMPAIDPRLARQACDEFRRPYLFTEEDMARMLDVARNLPSPHAPLRPLTVYTMLVLSYCAGLRLGELARLTVGDINLEDATIEIRETKFFKSRRLPVASSVLAALHNYLDARRQAGAPTDVTAGLFWHQQPAGPYSFVTIHELLTGIIRRAGFKPHKGYVGPRVHDIRHSFVANRMLAWYREGINPQSRLPYLATYLGHKDINSTLVYLTITQELLQQAGNRFHTFAADALHESTGALP